MPQWLAVGSGLLQCFEPSLGWLENALGLDYNVLKPTFRDIDLVKKNLVELMPYLEESERPVITTAYANLLDLEGTLSVDFGTTLGLLTDKATRYSQQMQGKIARYPKKFKDIQEFAHCDWSDKVVGQEDDNMANDFGCHFELHLEPAIDISGSPIVQW